MIQVLKTCIKHLPRRFGIKILRLPMIHQQFFVQIFIQNLIIRVTGLFDSKGQHPVNFMSCIYHIFLDTWLLEFLWMFYAFVLNSVLLTFSTCLQNANTKFCKEADDDQHLKNYGTLKFYASHNMNVPKKCIPKLDATKCRVWTGITLH